MNVLRRMLTAVAVLTLTLCVDAATSKTLLAQPVVVNTPPGTLPRTVPTTASVTIGGTFAIVPVAPALVQTTQQGNPCNPGACFTGNITVTANQAWQLQVRVKPTSPSTFYVNWLTPTNVQVRLNTDWYTIQSGGTSSGTLTPLKFNANRTTGRGGVTPTAIDLSSYIEFRVVGS